MKKALAMATLVAMLAAILPARMVRTVGASSPSAVLHNIPYDISIQLKNRAAPQQPAPAAAALLATHDGRPPDLVLTLEDWSSVHPGSHQVGFWLERTGVHSYVYVAWNDLQAPPGSAQQYQQITSADVEYIGRQFDEVIWASDTTHFGRYVNRPASDARVSLMIYNIRDEAYWADSDFYIAGYFWANLNEAWNRNFIFLDSFDWPDRTGAQGSEPYLYEGTTAHELEHLIHNDLDPDEMAFVDEGLADLAQFFSGYGQPAGHIAYYMVYHRDSLIDWNDDMYDYGSAYLWQLYLMEHFGGAAFSKRLVAEQENGLAGIRKVLHQMAPKAELASVFRDWTIANLLDGQTDNPAWNYQSLQIPSADTWNYSIPWSVDHYYNGKTGGSMPPTRHAVRTKAGVEPWGAYYATYKGVEPAMVFTFQGDATEGVTPPAGTLEWYSGMGNLLANTLSRSLTLGPRARLTFKTWYDIERDWDYGYVEVSAAGGPWVPLQPTTAIPYGTVDTNSSAVWAGPGGLTGSSGGWVTARYDLSAFTGPVQIRLRYATDEATSGIGWYADEFLVEDSAGTIFADPVAGANGWTAAGWQLTTGQMPNEFALSLVVPRQEGKKTATDVLHVALDPATESGTKLVDTRNLKQGVVTAVVNNHPAGPFDGHFRLTGIKAP